MPDPVAVGTTVSVGPVGSMIRDRQFYAFSAREQMQLLRDADPEFARLPEADQRAILVDIHQRVAPSVRAPLPSEVGEPLMAGQKLVRSAAPSIAGGALGGLVGLGVTAATGGTGAVTIPTFTGLGAAAGEATQQFFDPLQSGEARGSLLQIGAAGAIPIGGAAARRFFLSLPGASAGLQDFLLSRTGPTGGRLVEKFAPSPGTAKRLFAQASQQGSAVMVTPSAVAKATKDLAAELNQTAPALVTPNMRRVVAAGEQLARGGGGPTSAIRDVAFDEFRTNQQLLGAHIRAMTKKGGVALGQAKKLYAAMWEDLNRDLAAAAGPTGETLRRALEAFKREEAARFVSDAFGKSLHSRVGRVALDVDGLLDRLRKTEDVLGRLMPAKEIEDLTRTVQRFSNIPLPGKQAGLGFEGTSFATRAVVGGAAGAAVESLGGGSGVFGGAAGILAVEALSLALTTPPGRALVRTLASQGVPLEQIGTVLLQVGRTDAPQRFQGSLEAFEALKGIGRVRVAP